MKMYHLLYKTIYNNNIYFHYIRRYTMTTNMSYYTRLYIMTTNMSYYTRLYMMTIFICHHVRKCTHFHV